MKGLIWVGLLAMLSTPPGVSAEGRFSLEPAQFYTTRKCIVQIKGKERFDCKNLVITTKGRSLNFHFNLSDPRVEESVGTSFIGMLIGNNITKLSNIWLREYGDKNTIFSVEGTCTLLPKSKMVLCNTDRIQAEAAW